MKKIVLLCAFILGMTLGGCTYIIINQSPCTEVQTPKTISPNTDAELSALPLV